MTEAPERIWAWVDNLAGIVGTAHCPETPSHIPGGPNAVSRTAEYIRADLFDAVKAERDNYKALYEAERDDELLNIARQAGYQDGVEERRKLEARVKALTEALDERQDSGRDFWMKWTQKRLETRNAMFLRDAKLALGGDMRALRTRVEMMEAEPMQIVLSAALQENTDATNP